MRHNFYYAPAAKWGLYAVMLSICLSVSAFVRLSVTFFLMQLRVLFFLSHSGVRALARSGSHQRRPLFPNP